MKFNISDWKIPRCPVEAYRLCLEGGRIDIPHQIGLGEEFAENAVARGLISTTRPLLIIGAGAAGVSLAIRAARLGIAVTLRDKSSIPFAPQARSNSRWLHPYQYTWPDRNFRVDTFPADGSDHPLKWSANFASEIAKEWKDRFEERISGASGLIEVEYKFPVAVPLDLNAWLSFLQKHDPRLQYGAYAFCTGRRERCKTGPFQGFPFWSSDPFDESYFGLGKPPRVLISGGGDGAQQDLLRMAWNRPPVEIASMIEDLAESEESWRQAWMRLKEHLARNDEFERPINSLNGTFWHAISDRIRESLRPDFDPGRFCFAFKSSQPRQNYPLNRFLVEILRRFVGENFGHDLFKPKRTVTRVVADEAHPCGNPEGCIGRSHSVDYGNSTGVFDVIVIRHGLHPF